MATNRRAFLRSGAVAAGSVLALSPFSALRQRSELRASATSGNAGYGHLVPVRDESTGLPLFKLPHGFRYVTFGWTGDALADGTPTPPLHDGMAVVHADGSRLTLIRNHEIAKSVSAFAPRPLAYDPHAGGGCTRLVFDGEKGALISAEAAISGTLKNCAGGPTTWESWLTCEESVLGTGETTSQDGVTFEKDHGFVFDVPAKGTVDPVPLTDMGRFVHEAVAVDPATGFLYETEDQNSAGFYRFRPSTPGDLSKGGKLEMMKVEGRLELWRDVPVDAPLPVSWVPIEDPTRAHSPGKKDGLGVFSQGHAQGGSRFVRLEGCWFGQGKVYFNSTSGGAKGQGQVWEYDPQNELLRLVFESPGPEVLAFPDNITVSPRGSLILCEDSDHPGERLSGLTTSGELFVFAENHIQLSGEHNGIKGDYRACEWCGAAFSPDGKWLFVNIQDPGITVAITGPWEDGPL